VVSSEKTSGLVAGCCRELQDIAWQCVAVCGSVWQCVAVCCGVFVSLAKEAYMCRALLPNCTERFRVNVHSKAGLVGLFLAKEFTIKNPHRGVGLKGCRQIQLNPLRNLAKEPHTNRRKSPTHSWHKPSMGRGLERLSSDTKICNLKSPTLLRIHSAEYIPRQGILRENTLLL